MYTFINIENIVLTLSSRFLCLCSTPIRYWKTNIDFKVNSHQIFLTRHAGLLSPLQNE